MVECLYVECDIEVLVDLYEQYFGVVYEEGLISLECIVVEFVYWDDQIEQFKLQLVNVEGCVCDDVVVREYWWWLVVQELFDEYLEVNLVVLMKEVVVVFKVWCYVYDCWVFFLIEWIEVLESGVRGIIWLLMQEFRFVIIRVVQVLYFFFEFVGLVNDFKCCVLGFLQDGLDGEEGS